MVVGCKEVLSYHLVYVISALEMVECSNTDVIETV